MSTTGLKTLKEKISSKQIMIFISKETVDIWAQLFKTNDVITFSKYIYAKTLLYCAEKCEKHISFYVY